MATDVELVEAVLSGERQQFALLVERYQRDIYNVGYRSTNNRQDAQDVTQETFLRAFRSLARYDTGRSLRTWLYTIAVNVCRDWARTKERRPQAVALLDSDGSDPVSPDPNRSAQPQDVVIDREIQRTVQAAVMELDPDYRLLVILFYMRGLPQAEIADIMGLPLSVVKNRLYRARKRLRQTLGYALSEVNDDG